MAANNNLDEERGPLLENSSEPETVRRNPIQSVVSQAFRGTANLTNLLPIGTLLAFRLLSPVLTSGGECEPFGRSLTIALVSVCGLLCFLLSFTDSFTDRTGNISYGFATFRGVWVIDGSTTLRPEVAAKYRLKLIDFLHAFIKIMVFGAVALLDQNVVNCLYPLPSDKAKKLIANLPIAIGGICSALFVMYPTQRHGIGFPVANTTTTKTTTT